MMDYNDFMIEYNQIKTEQSLISNPTKDQILEFKHKHWNLHQKYLTSRLLEIIKYG